MSYSITDTRCFSFQVSLEKLLQISQQEIERANWRIDFFQYIYYIYMDFLVQIIYR